MHKSNGLLQQMLNVIINIEPRAGYLLTNYLGSDLLFITASKYEEALVRFKYLERKFLEKRESKLGFCQFASNVYSASLYDDNMCRVFVAEDKNLTTAGVQELRDKMIYPPVCKFEGSIRFRNCQIDFEEKGEKRGFVYKINGKIEDNFVSKQEAFDAMMNNLSCTGIK